MTAVKALVAAALVCAGIGGALVAGFIAAIVYSGCFLECSQPNHGGGVLLGALALALFLAGCVLAVVMWRKARTWQAVKVWAGVVLGVPTLWFALGLGRAALGF